MRTRGVHIDGVWWHGHAVGEKLGAHHTLAGHALCTLGCRVRRALTLEPTCVADCQTSNQSLLGVPVRSARHSRWNGRPHYLPRVRRGVAIACDHRRHVISAAELIASVSGARLQVSKSFGGADVPPTARESNDSQRRARGPPHQRQHSSRSGFFAALSFANLSFAALPARPSLALGLLQYHTDSRRAAVPPCLRVSCLVPLAFPQSRYVHSTVALALVNRSTRIEPSARTAAAWLFTRTLVTLSDCGG